MPLSCNLGTLTSWNPLGHSRPVTGLLYLYVYKYRLRVCNNFCISTATMVARTRLHVTLYVHWHYIPYVVLYVISVLSWFWNISLPHVPPCKYACQVQRTSAWSHKQLVPLNCPHDFSHKRLNSMQEGPFVAANSSWNSQYISCTVWKLNVHCCFHKSLAIFCALNQVNQSHTLQCCLYKTNFNIILQTIYIKD